MGFTSGCAGLTWHVLPFGVFCVAFAGYWLVVVFVGCLLCGLDRGFLCGCFDCGLLVMAACLIVPA